MTFQGANGNAIFLKKRSTVKERESLSGNYALMIFIFNHFFGAKQQWRPD